MSALILAFALYGPPAPQVDPLYQEWHDLGCYTTLTFEEWRGRVRGCVDPPSTQPLTPPPVAGSSAGGVGGRAGPE